jgi:hypothetical protein
MLLPVDPHLTRDPCDDKLAITHKGQAHFAGTGPSDGRCIECRYWQTHAGIAPAYDRHKKIKPQVCAKRTQMTGHVGTTVPPKLWLVATST